MSNDSANEWVYAFDEGDGKNKTLLGGKGANLCEMTQIGLNVPPGFVISTDACLHYLGSNDNALPDDMMQQVRELGCMPMERFDLKEQRLARNLRDACTSGLMKVFKRSWKTRSEKMLKP